MTVKEIVAEYLRTHGYDGLYNSSAECACELSNLVPCCDAIDDCEASHKEPCTGSCEFGGYCAWHMRPGRAATEDGENG